MSRVFQKRQTPLYVISDLHLGAGRRDSFSDPDREKDLMRFLDQAERQQAQVIILGDFLDLWRFNLSAILEAHPAIIKRFSEMDCVYVPGNHDLAVHGISDEIKSRYNIFNKVGKPFSMEIGGRNFLFCHGHEVDSLNRYIKPFMGKALGHSAILIEHLAGNQVFDSDNIRGVLFEAEAVFIALWSMMVLGLNRFVNDSLTLRRMVLDFLKKKHNIKTICKYEDYLDDKYTIINAHTHKAGNFNNCYFNSGSWSLGNSDFLRILPDGAAEVLKWTSRGAAKNDTILA